MPTVNPLKIWRAVIAPTPGRTVGQIKSLESGSRARCQLKSGVLVDALGSGYQVNDWVLIQEGRIVRQVSSLPVTSQAI